MSNILQSLIDIVGDKGVSNAPEELWFYSRDPGVLAPHKPDFVVAPKSTEEVQKIVQLAGRENIPVVPMGNGMSLAGLVIPLKGGIVLDMKRMNKILEVNAMARYAVLEGGTSQGALKAYLQKNHPTLRHSLPDAPPTTTIAANVSLHGQGRLTNQYGFNSDMVTGLEVVLPAGEICRIGSPSIGPYWFSKGPTLPDLSGLFLGWLGSTGIITKVGLKLFPNKKIRDVELFVTDRADLVPKILYKLTHLEMLEDINVWFQPKPQMFLGNFHITIFFTGDTEEEVEFIPGLIEEQKQDFMSDLADLEAENVEDSLGTQTEEMEEQVEEMPQEESELDQEQEPILAGSEMSLETEFEPEESPGESEIAETELVSGEEISEEPTEEFDEIFPGSEEASKGIDNLEEAKKLLTSGEVDQSINVFKDLIKENIFLEDIISNIQNALDHHYPINIDLWKTLGDAFLKNKQFQKALDAYSKAEDLLS